VAKHADAVSIHLGAHVSDVDPGAVGPGKLWVDTSVGPPYRFWVRTSDDSGWQEVASVSDSTSGMTITNEALASAGASATASSENDTVPGSEQVPGLAIDADDATEWATALPAGGTEGAAGAWLQVDLGSVKTIAGVRLAQSANSAHRATSSTLQTSPDGLAGWTDQLAFDTVNDSGVVALPAPIAARYWRMLGVSGPVNQPWGIRTFALFSSVPSSSSMTNPMTTPGDLIVGGTAGAPGRMAKGANSTYLGVDSGGALGYLATSSLPTSGMTNPMTTAGDLIVGGSSGAPGRLAKGTDGQVLTVDPATHLLIWATPAAGGSGGHTIQDEGAPLASRAGLNFIGAGVTAADDAANNRTNVTITGGGGGGSDLESILTQKGDLVTVTADYTLGTDRALGGTATSDSSYGGHLASYTNDNNPATAWWSGTAGESWVANDLGAAYPIRGFQYVHEGGTDNHWEHYWIETSADGIGGWTVRYTSPTGLDAIADSGVVVISGTFTERYWRIRGGSTGLNGIKMVRFSLYELTPATPTRLGKGATGTFLRVGTSGSLEYAVAPGFSSPMTTSGDLIVGASSAAPINHAVPATAGVTARNGTTPEYVIDGNDTSEYWSGSGSQVGDWLQIDLGAAYPIDHIRMLQTPTSGFFATQVTVSWSDNGSAFTNQQSFETPAGGDTGRVNLTGGPFTHRYWRVTVDSGAGSGWSVQTIELLETLPSGGAARLAAGAIGSFLKVVDLGGAVPGLVWAGLYHGSGAPASGLGANGEFYFRSDTPGTANQRIYVKSAGAWVGIV
jgi:hypothetical protein